MFFKALLLSLLPVVFAETRNFDFVINNAVVKPDGFERSAVLVNGQYPGPLLTANKGDHIVIPTHNQLTDPHMRRSTSIHWHGFFQPRTSAMDGPSFVNQCPIPPNTTFTYEFDTNNQSGNFWYHSHLSTQYCDGLRGAFVVYDPDDPLKHLYDVDDESTIITLEDWYHIFAPQGNDQFFNSNMPPVPDSGLINGKGRYVNGPLVPYAVVNVEQGKRYRLRVFALSCRPFFTFSIDGHNVTFMEADGIEHDPVEVQNFTIWPAQRISAILNANQPVDNYWIRAPPTGGNPANNPNFDPNLTLAILRYKGASDAEPKTVNVAGRGLLDQDMHPIAQEGPGKLGSGPADKSIVLNIDNTIHPPFFDINGISYISPSVPVLLQLLSGAKRPEDLLPSEQVFIIERNKIIDVTFPVATGHPFHLHGHTFDVIRTSGEEAFNFENPPRRDVYPINGNTTFRFFSDNPGAWFLHCHIDWHLEAGLAIVFAEAPEDNVSGPAAQITPDDWKDLCPEYNEIDPEFQ
ncbi:multicopper oxidase [Macrolepiota fuliginosa MF-IS2]|uniref:Multicopper oxidase n=1 Tax=Macrolepiota fuliginosa MF-IS2 TaxID=1400762 RepID=A0A9P5XEQ3_9AGAR|nr:multicopper oxidase [Macrolepiota fuliginosa MF-IS2]